MRCKNLILGQQISIHALREEGDHGHAAATRHLDISIHALREEGDAPELSRLEGHRYFYPRPPRGGRPDQFVCRSRCPEISIHALREEGDMNAFCFLP